MVSGRQPCLDIERVTPPPPIDDVAIEDKENSPSISKVINTREEKPKKKSAIFADIVEVCLSYEFPAIFIIHVPGARHRDRSS